jgi:hypothetical protein
MRAYISGVTNQEQDILTALLQLEEAVKTMAHSQPKPNLLPLFAKLDKLTSELPADADPSLRHYLERKSYEKALLHLSEKKSSGGPSPRHRF